MRYKQAVALVRIANVRSVPVRESEGRQMIGQAVDLLQADDVGVVMEYPVRRATVG